MRRLTLITLQTELTRFFGALSIVKEAVFAVYVTVSVDYRKHVPLDIIGHLAALVGVG